MIIVMTVTSVLTGMAEDVLLSHVQKDYMNLGLLTLVNHVPNIVKLVLLLLFVKDVPVPLPGSPDPIKSKEPVNSTVCTSEPLTSRTSDPLLASEKALATKSGEFASTSSLRSPSITVSSANTDLLKLFELFEVSYKPFTSTTEMPL